MSWKNRTMLLECVFVYLLTCGAQHGCHVRLSLQIESESSSDLSEAFAAWLSMVRPLTIWPAEALPTHVRRRALSCIDLGRTLPRASYLREHTNCRSRGHRLHQRGRRCQTRPVRPSLSTVSPKHQPPAPSCGAPLQTPSRYGDVSSHSRQTHCAQSGLPTASLWHPAGDLPLGPSDSVLLIHEVLLCLLLLFSIAAACPCCVGWISCLSSTLPPTPACWPLGRLRLVGSRALFVRF